MSFRSALTNPSSTSGGVGQTFTGANPSTTPILVSNATYILDSVTLTAGVYSFVIGIEVELVNGTTLASFGVSITSNSVILYNTQLLQEQSITGGGPDYFLPLQNTTTLVLSQETTLNLNVTAVFSSGSVKVGIPNNILKYIQAVKMA